LIKINRRRDNRSPLVRGKRLIIRKQRVKSSYSSTTTRASFSSQIGSLIDKNSKRTWFETISGFPGPIIDAIDDKWNLFIELNPNGMRFVFYCCTGLNQNLLAFVKFPKYICFTSSTKTSSAKTDKLLSFHFTRDTKNRRTIVWRATRFKSLENYLEIILGIWVSG